MGNHTFTRYVTETSGEHYARCKCGETTGYKDTLQQVEDAEMAHLRHIARVRATLGGGRTPSLADQRDYFEKMAEDHHQTDEQRRLWRQLADEMTKRVGDRNENPRHAVETPLFEID